MRAFVRVSYLLHMKNENAFSVSRVGPVCWSSRFQRTVCGLQQDFKVKVSFGFRSGLGS